MVEWHAGCMRIMSKQTGVTGGAGAGRRDLRIDSCRIPACSFRGEENKTVPLETAKTEIVYVGWYVMKSLDG